MSKQSIKDLTINDLKNKTVLVRVDFNVPLKDGQVSDDTRIRSALPTINYLREKGAKIVLVSHLGRPKGREEKYTLAPVAEHLQKKLNVAINLLNDCVGEQVEENIKNGNPDAIFLLENIRFYPEETKNERGFSEKLAKLADIYVNDAFGTAHRAHSSTAGVAEFLPAYSGLLLEKEIAFLSKALNPEKPFMAIIGGSKVSSKIGVLKNLVNKTDFLVIGGAMTYTFLKFLGQNTGLSLVEDDYLSVAGEIIAQAEKNNCRLLLPVDHLVAESFESAQGTITEEIPADRAGFDIGPKTIEQIRKALVGVKTVVWNGPMGVFEKSPFAEGTFAVAKMLAEATKSGTVTIVGGGDSVAAVEQAGLGADFSHISTGGGASLEFLEGLELPGISVLKDK